MLKRQKTEKLAILKRQKTEKLVSQYVNFREKALKSEDESGAQSRSKFGVGLVSNMITKWRKQELPNKEGTVMTEQNAKIHSLEKMGYIKQGSEMQKTQNPAGFLHIDEMQGLINKGARHTKQAASNAIEAGERAVESMAGGARDAMKEFLQGSEIRSSASATKIQARERGRQQRQRSSQGLRKQKSAARDIDRRKAQKGRSQRRVTQGLER
jgi:hypothetical protein